MIEDNRSKTKSRQRKNSYLDYGSQYGKQNFGMLSGALQSLAYKMRRIEKRLRTTELEVGGSFPCTHMPLGWKVQVIFTACNYPSHFYLDKLSWAMWSAVFFNLPAKVVIFDT